MGNKGSINIYGNYARFYICSVKDLLDVIIPHFDNFPLRTAKYADYRLFREAVVNIKNGNHLSIKGLQ